MISGEGGFFMPGSAAVILRCLEGYLPGAAESPTLIRSRGLKKIAGEVA